VTFIDPKNTYISEQAVIGRDTVIYPNVRIEGESFIGDGTTVRSGTRITNSRIGSAVQILDNSIVIDSQVGNQCTVGPFAHLRDNAVMEEGAKVGNFVELKKTNLGRGSKANHLTYLGDATIGENTNIGAGTITCNYDGKRKHPTTIGNNVKIGSDTMLVAPVKVGDGAATGAGSVVTKDVEKDSLVVGAPARAIKKLSGQENNNTSQ
jgi:bifunctional UDP-N-acetylglucosamine pyrophosphorylase/glucosamine-1-phosphate N-acetyltransferase